MTYEKKCKVIILILTYEPIFSDGRVVRMKCFSEYLKNKGIPIALVHLSNETIDQYEGDNSRHHIKYPGLGMGDVNSRKTSKTSGRLISLMKYVSRRAFPDRFLFSFLAVSKKLKEISKPGDTLVVSMPHFSVMLMFINYRLVPKGIKVVFDYRDMWIGNDIFIRGKFQGWLAKKIESKSLSFADAIMVTTESAKQYFFEKKTSQVFTVTNGISTNDYEKIKGFNVACLPHKIDNITDVRVGYFGNIGNRRNCMILFKTLIDMQVDLQVYGSIDKQHMELCGDSYKGTVSRESALEFASECDLLVVVIRVEEDSSNAIPGKIFEYMALKKPILAYCPDNALVVKVLRDYAYPHIFINSESQGRSLHSLEKSILNIFSNNDLSSVTDILKYDVPIREREFDKVFSIICPWVN